MFEPPSPSFLLGGPRLHARYRKHDGRPYCGPFVFGSCHLCHSCIFKENEAGHAAGRCIGSVLKLAVLIIWLFPATGIPLLGGPCRGSHNFGRLQETFTARGPRATHHMAGNADRPPATTGEGNLDFRQPEEFPISFPLSLFYNPNITLLESQYNPN